MATVTGQIASKEPWGIFVSQLYRRAVPVLTCQDVWIARAALIAVVGLLALSGPAMGAAQSMGPVSGVSGLSVADGRRMVERFELRSWGPGRATVMNCRPTQPTAVSCEVRMHVTLSGIAGLSAIFVWHDYAKLEGTRRLVGAY